MADTEEKLQKDAHYFWDRVKDSDNVKKYAHWRKSLGESKWVECGKIAWSKYQKLLSLAGSIHEEGKMIDWGVGGGAASAYFINKFNTIFGIDICELTLAEAQQQVDSVIQAERHFHPILTTLNDPRTIFDSKVHLGEIDFFLSTACFHHMHSKAYAAEVLKVAFDALKPAGLALIQIRWNDNSPYYRPKNKNYALKKNAIRFLSFGMQEITQLCNSIGFTVLSACDMEFANCLYVYLRKP